MEVLPQQLPAWLNVSRETLQKLTSFSARVLRWNSAVNLISKASAQEVWNRHVLDSAQLFNLAPQHMGRWVDLGSGGGFPGLVISILAGEKSPDTEVILVESDHRKAAFLQESARELGLKTNVIAKRLEGIAGMQADVLSARALAPLDVLCGFAELHLKKSGTALFPKGKTFVAEVESAQRNWVFDVEYHVSKTDSDTVVLCLRSIAHV